jgi:hypothetical protein
MHAQPSISAKSLTECIRTVFLPKLTELWSLDDITGEDVIPLIHNDPSHISERVLGLLQGTCGRAITAADQPGQVFQEFDISLLEILMR